MTSEKALSAQIRRGSSRNIIGALADPRVGIFVVTPFLVLLLLRVRPALLDGPAWARGAALGGTLYLLIQLKANRYTGGAGFVGYRYPLEALAAAAPVLALAYPHWARESRILRSGFWLLVAGSVVVYVIWWGLPWK